jgi:hypothetical protein
VIDYVKLVKSSVEDAVERHRVEDEARMELNMALKSVLLEIVYKWILREEQAAGAEAGAQ